MTLNFTRPESRYTHVHAEYIWFDLMLFFYTTEDIFVWVSCNMSYLLLWSEGTERR